MNYNDLFIDDKLPNPLSQKELYDYFEKMKSGDTSAREIIILHNIKIVLATVIDHFNNTPYEEKELVSIGLIGLIKSVDTFDISKKYQFSSYCCRCIDNEILMFLRKGKKYLNDVSLEKPIRTDSKENELRVEDTLCDENSDFVSDYERNEINIIIRQLFEELTGRDKEIITLYFGFDDNKRYTQKEIANKLGIHRTYVSKIINNLLRRMNMRLKECGIVESSYDEIIKRKKMIKNLDKKKGTECMSRHLKSIYENLKEFKKEEIDEALSELGEDERKIIALRYGDDLENPVTSPEWTIETQKKFYGSVLPKIARMLSKTKNKINYKASSKTKKQNQKRTFDNDISQEKPIVVPVESSKDQIIDNPVDNSVMEDLCENKFSLPLNAKDELDEDEQEQNIMVKEDYTKILELLRSPLFKQLLSTLPPKEAVIIALKFGYLDGKFYTTKFVASLLGIEELDVIELTKKVLSVYKENINRLIDTCAQVVTDEPLMLKCKSKRH